MQEQYLLKSYKPMSDPTSCYILCNNFHLHASVLLTCCIYIYLNYPTKQSLDASPFFKMKMKG